MRVAFLQAKDFSTRFDRGSGTWAFLCQELERQGHPVTHLDGEDLCPPFATRALKAVSRRLGWGYRSYEDPFLGRRIGRELSRRLSTTDCEVVLSNNLLISAYVEPARRIVVYTDTVFPFDYRHNDHPRLQGLAPYSVRFSQRMTRRGLSRADSIVFPASWCLEEAARYVPEVGAHGKIVPFGANLTAPPGPDCAAGRSFAAVTAKGRLDLLFVGVDWQRKGGDVAVATLEELGRRRIEARLHVVGPTLPEKGLPPNLRQHGFLDKRRRDDRIALEKLYRQADAFILPTRIEGFGIAAAEAAAYGLPVLAYRSRGISDAVADGASGILIDPTASAAAFANAIEAWFLRPEVYDRLVRGSRRHFETEVNWSVAVGRLLDVLAPRPNLATTA